MNQIKNEQNEPEHIKTGPNYNTMGTYMDNL